MSTIVENTNPVTVDIEPKYSVTPQSGAIVENKAPEYSVSVQRKEYKVVGDNIYIPRLYDDAPQWMKDLVNTVVDVKTAVAVGNLDDALEALRTLSDELNVAKNTYTNSIISSNDIDQRINTAIETLNSALSDADATIMNIAQTATTPAEASAIALNTLSASLSASGEIGSFISNMNSAFADLDSTTTQSINLMESAINAEFSANATALNTIRTYVGIDGDGNGTGTGVDGRIIANAEAITQLGVDISNEAGIRAAGDTTVTNTVKAYADSVGAGVETKWAYNSIVNINGIYKKSGFGLTTNYTSGAGTEANPYVSEFWIDATKLRFTNSNQTGRVAPFTIDASGITPEITFNGKVAFTNVTGYTPPDVSGDINANNDVFAQRLGYANYASMVSAAESGQTLINGGYINTSLIQANAITANMINTNGLIAENISANEIIGKTITGSTINGSTINGAVVKTSYLDLDGDLEVLTDYHLSKTQAQLNAVIAAGGTGRLVLEADKVENGGDAVYTAADEYRIPTLSLVSEQIQNFTGSGIKTLVGKIFPYNSTTVNSNLKAKKLRPAISVAIESAIYSANDLGINGNLGYNGGYYPLLPDNPNFSNGNGTLVEIWFGGVLLIRFGSYYPYNITHRCYIYDALTKTYVDGGYYLTYSPSLIDKTLVLNTSTFDVKLHYIRAYSQSCDGEGCTSSRRGEITMSILPKTFTLPFDFTSGNLEIRSVYNSYNFNLKIPSGISINNMI